jgi:hypothetical protein
MKKVDERPEGAKFRAISWENAEQVRSWLSSVEEQVGELGAAARDRLRKRRERVLSRHEASRQAQAAMQALDRLLAAAKAGLDPLPEPPDGPEEEEPPQSERRPMPSSSGTESG